MFLNNLLHILLGDTMGKAKPLEVKIHDIKEFDKRLLENAVKVVEGKAKLIPVKELKE